MIVFAVAYIAKVRILKQITTKGSSDLDSLAVAYIAKVRILKQITTVIRHYVRDDSLLLISQR